MSDRPTAVNGKRSQTWGTTSACPECGECLCFACHPQGPCIDEHHHSDSAYASPTPRFTSGAEELGWTLGAGGAVPRSA